MTLVLGLPTIIWGIKILPASKGEERLAKKAQGRKIAANSTGSRC